MWGVSLNACSCVLRESTDAGAARRNEGNSIRGEDIFLFIKSMTRAPREGVWTLSVITLWDRL